MRSDRTTKAPSLGVLTHEVRTRYLYACGDDSLFAYAPGRLDYFRASDDTLWAHQSHDWLLAATSGVVLAHRTKNVFYSAVNGEPLYYEMAESGPSDAAAPDRARLAIARDDASTSA